MPKPLSDDEIQEIIDAYDEHGTFKAVGEELDYDQETVSKYVKENHPDFTGGGPESETDPDSQPDGFTAPPPSGSEPSDNPLDEPTLEDMDEGEFIEWFFDHAGHGVRSNFANNLSTHCRIRGEIPNKAEMANRLMKQNSGISKEGDVEMISDNYWAAAQRWLDARGRSPPGSQQGGYVTPGGQWVSNGQGQQQQRGAPGGSWVSNGQGQGQQPAPPSGGGWISGDQEQSQGQSQGQHDQQRHVATPQPRHPGGGANQAVKELREDIRELKEVQMRQMKDQRGSDGDQVQSLKEKFAEMVEIQQTLDQMQGSDGGDDQAIAALQAQLDDIKTELERAQREDDGGTIQVTGDDGFGAIASLAAQGDVDPETLGVLADAMGVTDPEVKKAEYDYKKTQEKMKNRQELVDNVFDNLGEVSGDLFGGLLSALQSAGDDGDDDDDEPQPRGPVRPPQEQPSPTPTEPSPGTRPAGSSTLQQGEIQVVGDEPQSDQPAAPDDSGMSPARRRHMDALQDGGDSPQPVDESEFHETEDGEVERDFGGFRSPGGPEDAEEGGR